MEQQSSRRMPPQGMPAQAPRPDRTALRGQPRQPDMLPQQRPVTDDAPPVKQPSPLRRMLVRAGAAVLVLVALILAYLFLLLGEPDEDAQSAALPAQETITLPMSPFEMPGESNVQTLADTFGQPVLALQGGPSMYKARIYDTALSGSYARRVTLTYTFEDGTPLTVESLRPTDAVTLLGGDGYSLDATSLYALGGLNAARMDNDAQICVFGQNDTAVYAVLCPQSHAGELEQVLRQTQLIAPAEGE